MLMACRQVQKETDNIFYKKNAFAYQWHVFPIVDISARKRLFLPSRNTFSSFCPGPWLRACRTERYFCHGQKYLSVFPAGQKGIQDWQK